MKVRFYNFKKRVNSCKQPTGTYTEKECRWKEETSTHDPIIEISGNPNMYWNYAYIPDWGKCYFVRDVTTEASGLSRYSLTEDVLATHRAEIRDSKQLVAFCSDAAGYDKYRPDPRITVSTTKTVTSVTHSMSMLNSTGCYILTVHNNSPIAEAVGFGVSYMLNAANMAELREWMGSPSVLASLQSYFGGGTPLQSIFGCIWIPFAYTESDATLGTVVNNVLIGNQSSQLAGYDIKAVRLFGFVTKTESIALSLSGVLRDDFRRCEPYTSAALHLPGCGVIGFNLSDWVTAHQVQMSAILEITTGNILYVLRDPDGHIVQTASACLAAQCPLAQMTTNVQGAVNSVIGFASGVAAVATGGIGVAIGAQMLASASQAALAVNQRAPSVSGHVGGRVSSQVTTVSLTIFEAQTEDPGGSDYVDLKGRTSGKVCTLSSLIGFIQCVEASVPIAGNKEEADEINSYLNSGIFME